MLSLIREGGRIMLTMNYILARRMENQGFTQGVSTEDYDSYVNLFRCLQPVSPKFFTRPGDPPSLVHRTSTNDMPFAEQLRKDHKIIKARFNGGRVGYVWHEDLKLYAQGFMKLLKTITPLQEELLDYIREASGVMKEQIREDLPFIGRKLSPTLKRLQEAFLVYEDQQDGDWDTAWFNFQEEWFELDQDVDISLQAKKTIVRKFIEVYYFASFENIKSWSAFSNKDIKTIIQELLKEKVILEVTIDDALGYMIADDDYKKVEMKPFVRMLDQSDFCVRAELLTLKEIFSEYEVLQYLLIDGSIKGAVCGHWRIGPHDIDDIVLLIHDDEIMNRKEEIIKAVRDYYPSTTTAIKKFHHIDQ